MKSHYESGETLTEVGHRFGVTSSAVRYQLQKIGVKLRRYTTSDKVLKRNRSIGIMLDKEKLVQLYIEEKQSLEQVGLKLNTHIGLVRKSLKFHAIPIRKGGRFAYVQLTKKQLENLFVKQQLSIKEIAERSGCHPSTVSKKLKKHGLSN